MGNFIPKIKVLSREIRKPLKSKKGTDIWAFGLYDPEKGFLGFDM